MTRVQSSEVVDSILDYRVRKGRRMFLVKWRHIEELTWEPEAAIPRQADSQVFRLMQLKGEFAKRKVFEQLRRFDSGKTRRVTRSRSPDRHGGSDYGDSSDDDDLTSLAPKFDAVPLVTLATQAESYSTSDISLFLSYFSVDHFLNLPPPFDSLVALFREFRGVQGPFSRAQLLCESLFVCALAIALHSDTPEAFETCELLVRVVCQLRRGSHGSPAEFMLTEFLRRLSVREIQENLELVSQGRAKVGLACDGIWPLLRSLASLNEIASSRALTNEASDDVMAIDVHNAPTDHGNQSTRRELGKVEWRRLIYRVYELQNPEKVADVPEILDKYSHNLPGLFETVAAKYGLDCGHVALELFPGLGEYEPAQVRVSRVRRGLIELFACEDASRIGEVDAILARNVGKEHQVLMQLRKFYGVVAPTADVVVSGVAAKERSNESAFTEVIRGALAQSNFERLSSVPWLLEKYAGREQHLYRAICEKYAIKVDGAKFRRTLEAEEQRRAKLKQAVVGEVIEEIYRLHNPSKLQDVARLVEKYKGQERELLETVCTKYGVSVEEKIKKLAKLDENMDDCLWHRRLQELLLSLGVASGLKVALSVAKEAGRFWAAGDQQLGFFEGFGVGPGQGVAEGVMVVRTRLAKPRTEAEFSGQLYERLAVLFGDLVEAGELQWEVRPQEPEWWEWDAFEVAGEARGSATVRLKGRREVVVQAVQTVALWLEQARASLSGQAADMRAWTRVTVEEGGTAEGPDELWSPSFPTAARGRVAMWEGVEVASQTAVTRWRREVGVVVEGGRVTVVGSAEKRRAFDEVVREVVRVSREPDLVAWLPRRLFRRDELPLSAQLPTTKQSDEPDDWVEDPAPAVTEVERPLLLTPARVIDGWLRGCLCLNCDSLSHDAGVCPLRRVCWNCHGLCGAGGCSQICRMCGESHGLTAPVGAAPGGTVVECIKRMARRIAVSEASAVLALTEPVTVEGLKGLQLQTGAGLKDQLPPLPLTPPPVLPDGNFRWEERVFLDERLPVEAFRGVDVVARLSEAEDGLLGILETELEIKYVFQGYSLTAVVAGAGTQTLSVDELRLQVMVKAQTAERAREGREALLQLIDRLAESAGRAKPAEVAGLDRYEGGVELDLRGKDEEQGLLRHWLHGRGVEVEVEEKTEVIRIPGTSEIIKKLQEPEEDEEELEKPKVEEVFEAISDFSEDRWWEAFEVEPLGMLGLTGKQETDRKFLEPGQKVKLAESAVEELAQCLVASELISETSEEDVRKILRTFTGVVKAASQDFKLLLYLKFPYVLSSPADAELAENSPNLLPPALTAQMLRESGRIGTRAQRIPFINSALSWLEDPNAPGQPGDALLRRLAADRVPESELPYLGYLVLWDTPDRLVDKFQPYLTDSPGFEAVDELDELLKLNTADLRSRLEAQQLPVTGNKRDLAERLLQAKAAPTVAPSVPAPPPPPPPPAGGPSAFASLFGALAAAKKK